MGTLKPCTEFTSILIENSWSKSFPDCHSLTFKVSFLSPSLYHKHTPLSCFLGMKSDAILQFAKLNKQPLGLLNALEKKWGSSKEKKEKRWRRTRKKKKNNNNKGVGARSRRRRERGG